LDQRRKLGALDSKVAGVVELLRQGFRGSEIEIEKVFTKGKAKM